MSNDSFSTRSAQLKSPQYLASENEFESPSDRMQLTPSRAPLNSIPDPSQLLSKTHNQLVQHHFKEKPESSKSIGSKIFEAIAETELISLSLKLPGVALKYKNVEAMVEVKPDLSFVSVAPSIESADKISTKIRGSSSPFRCTASLVQQVNQEKDRELSNARLQIEELEALAVNRHKEVCVLNIRLAAAENMTHDVIRDLLSAKLDIANYAVSLGPCKIMKSIKAKQTNLVCGLCWNNYNNETRC